jgi:sulfate permease, SulP family
VRRHPDGQTFAGLLALRPVTPISHANAPRLRERTLDLVDAADPLPRVLVMDLGAVPDVDVTATDLLADFDAELRRRGVTLWMVNLNERPLDMLRRSPEAERYEPRLFRELDDAVAAFADPRTSPPPSA